MTPELFWAKVSKTSECWEWMGARTPKGYGRFEAAGYAHRYSYELHAGPIPAGKEVCHHCDNPPCVRPDHLFAGTRLDNVRDSVAKGRHNRGSASGTAKLTERDVVDIRLRIGAESVNAIARSYGMSAAAIRKVILGKTWAHVPVAAVARPDWTTFLHRGARHPHAVLTSAVVAEIRRRHSAGETIAAIARRLRLGETTVRRAVYERVWSDAA